MHKPPVVHVALLATRGMSYSHSCEELTGFTPGLVLSRHFATMAPTLKSTQILMKSRPKGFPSQDNFETSSTSISQDLTGADDVLVQLLD